MDRDEVLSKVEEYLEENIEEGDTEFDIEEGLVSIRIVPIIKIR